MSHQITIPKPCNEVWEDMTPATGGRNCAQCCKTVVDFTGWQQPDIVTYLQMQPAGKVCGRFDAVHVPAAHQTFVVTVARTHLPWPRQVAAVILLSLGILEVGCNTAATPPLGEVPTAIAQNTKSRQRMGKPAIIKPNTNHIKGEPALIIPDTSTIKKGQKAKKNKRPTKENTTLPEPPPQLMGAAVFIPDSSKILTH